MSKGSYAYEKLMGAMHDMATGGGTLDRRLESAASYLLMRLNQKDDFPPDLQPRWDALKQRLTREKAAADEGTLAATVRKMDEAELRKAAEEMWALFSELGGIATLRMSAS